MILGVNGVKCKMRIAVLMTCHNRRDKTVACLRAFSQAADVVPGLRPEYYLTDDGSTDGTAEAVRALNLNLTIIPGQGDLFWNRGMVMAWQEAARAATGYEGYLLLNDDTMLDADGLERLLKVSTTSANKAIVVGATRDPVTKALTYGGILRTSHWHPGRTERVPVSEETQEADTFNANCTLIPRVVFELIGTLDPTFHHSMGDLDYGFRARASGVRIIVAPGTVGTCPRNETRGTWSDRQLPLRTRLMLLESPKGLPRNEWKEYLRRNGAPQATILAWVPTLRVIASSLVSLLRIRVKRPAEVHDQ